VDRSVKPQSLHHNPPTAANKVYEATTRSCCAVTRATRCVYEFLLPIENIMRRPLPDPRFFAYTIEGNFGGVDLRFDPCAQSGRR
jgi:hypothetical protein